MSQPSNAGGSQEKPNYAIIIAAIGAFATIMTACVTGFFAMVPAVIEAFDRPTAAVANNVPVETPAPALATRTPEITATFTIAPPPTETLASPSPAPVLGMMFASKIAANGQALDPGVQFPPDITDLYAVFPANMTPPGTEVSVTNPLEGAYYAFLRIREGSSLSKIGWRWLRDGQVVNDYEMEVASGNDIWLSYANHSAGGIFSAPPFTQGEYSIVVLLGGNPSISADLMIVP